YAHEQEGRTFDALLEYLYEFENGSADDPYAREARGRFSEAIARNEATPGQLGAQAGQAGSGRGQPGAQAGQAGAGTGQPGTRAGRPEAGPKSAVPDTAQADPGGSDATAGQHPPS